MANKVHVAFHPFMPAEAGMTVPYGWRKALIYVGHTSEDRLTEAIIRHELLHLFVNENTRTVWSVLTWARHFFDKLPSSASFSPHWPKSNEEVMEDIVRNIDSALFNSPFSAKKNNFSDILHNKLQEIERSETPFNLAKFINWAYQVFLTGSF